MNPKAPKQLFKTNKKVKVLGRFPTAFTKPQADQDLNFTLVRQQQFLEDEKRTISIFQVADIGKDIAMQVLPWKQREALRVGWKVTKFLAGKD